MVGLSFGCVDIDVEHKTILISSDILGAGPNIILKSYNLVYHKSFVLPSKHPLLMR